VELSIDAPPFVGTRAVLVVPGTGRNAVSWLSQQSLLHTDKMLALACVAVPAMNSVSRLWCAPPPEQVPLTKHAARHEGLLPQLTEAGACCSWRPAFAVSASTLLDRWASVLLRRTRRMGCPSAAAAGRRSVASSMTTTTCSNSIGRERELKQRSAATSAPVEV